MASGLEKICFHKDGRPRSWLRAMLMKKSGEIRPVFHRVVFKKNGKPRQRYISLFQKDSLIAGSDSKIKNNMHVSDLLNTHLSALRPLTVFGDPSEPRRITLVTDSIGASSLFGGVGTALIFAALWAKHANAQLRIVTRTERPVTSALSAILKANRIDFDGQVEFLHSPHFGAVEIAVGSRDLFVATSWWTARCLLNTVPAERIVYLLQEDERNFYPYGDDHLNCSVTLAEPFAMVVVNSELLHQHLVEGRNAIPGLEKRSCYFEPAFQNEPRSNPSERQGKRKLFFYARPNNPRNLYLTGLKLINQSVIEGILDPAEWEIHFVGKNLDKLTFDGGLSVKYHEPMGWQDYKAFLRDMDAGISLMYSPHPSYPPIDLAAIGVPVLTNSFDTKTDLRRYSDNIICADLTLPALLDGVRKLTSLAKDPQACVANLEADNINHDWEKALADVIAQLPEFLEKRHHNVS